MEHQFSFSPLTTHAFNADHSMVAISSNSDELQIHRKSGNGWTLADTLTEHDKLITSVDWAPHTNRIVTCSQDRNAYVWNPVVDPATGQQKWSPSLVLLRLNRSATYVQWSPNEEKFAVASGARTVAVCQYDTENDWWVARHIKKPIRSTVLALDWHPNSILLATASADSKARVFSAFLKGSDQKPAPTNWGDKLPFHTLCAEYSTPSGGWVHGVAFSPSGEALAFTGHDSTISIAYAGGGVQVVDLHSLPVLSLVFVTETSLVGAGHDCQPYLFQADANYTWTLAGTLDVNQSKSGGARTAAAGRLNNEAFNLFKSADSRGANMYAAPEETALATTHQNTITAVKFYSGTREAVAQVSTSGVDGRLVVWDTRSVG
ncbi:actin-related protein 2/3 complex, subunit 1 [Atractiella rhizophila]|nr:actin-related protein 2/3 complex, subunit 1 [Atractiella rhizophila]